MISSCIGSRCAARQAHEFKRAAHEAGRVSLEQGAVLASREVLQRGLLGASRRRPLRPSGSLRRRGLAREPAGQPCAQNPAGASSSLSSAGASGWSLRAGDLAAAAGAPGRAVEASGCLVAQLAGRAATPPPSLARVCGRHGEQPCRDARHRRSRQRREIEVEQGLAMRMAATAQRAPAQQCRRLADSCALTQPFSERR
jgi:hypothetical protein